MHELVLTVLYLSLAPHTDKNIPEQLKEPSPFLDHVIFKAYSLISTRYCHVSGSMFYFSARHRESLTEKVKGKLALLILSF